MIVFFLPNLSAGGAEKVMISIGTHLINQKYPVLFLLGKATGPLYQKLPTGSKVYELNNDNALGMLFPFIKFVKTHKPDVIFATLGSSITTTLGRPFLPNNIRIVSRLGNTVSAEVDRLSLLGKWKYRFAAEVVSRFSDVQVFQSQFMKVDYETYIGKKIKKGVVIYNPVDYDITLKSSETEVKFYDFVAVGRLMTQKNYNYLIDLAEYLPNFTFAIIGEGELRSEIQKLIKDKNLSNRVEILGYISNPYPYMKKASFLISTSLYEGFSNVILESLALGTPVIATDCPSGNREVINENNGRLIPLNDINKSVSIINEAMNKLDSFDSNKIASETFFRFSLDQIAIQYQKILCPKK